MTNMNKKSKVTQCAKENIDKFLSVISDESTALEIIANIKWKDGFVCRSCGNTNYCKGKGELSRRCTRCKKEESVTANTLFHRCKIPISKAMEMAFLVCSTSDISSYELSRQIGIRHMTCYGLQKKVKDCLLDDSENGLLKEILCEINKRIGLIDGSAK